MQEYNILFRCLNVIQYLASLYSKERVSKKAYYLPTQSFWNYICILYVYVFIEIKYCLNQIEILYHLSKILAFKQLTATLFATALFVRAFFMFIIILFGGGRGYVDFNIFGHIDGLSTLPLFLDIW